MKPEKWNTRRDAMFGALAGAIYGLWQGWPSASSPELALWHYGGYIFGTTIGGHSDEVLREMLGVAEDEIASLRESGVIL